MSTSKALSAEFGATCDVPQSLGRLGLLSLGDAFISIRASLALLLLALLLRVCLVMVMFAWLAIRGVSMVILSSGATVRRLRSTRVGLAVRVVGR